MHQKRRLIPIIPCLKPLIHRRLTSTVVVVTTPLFGGWNPGIHVINPDRVSSVQECLLKIFADEFALRTFSLLPVQPNFDTRPNGEGVIIQWGDMYMSGFYIHTPLVRRFVFYPGTGNHPHIGTHQKNGIKTKAKLTNA